MTSADIQLCACGCGRQADLQIGIDTSEGPMRFNCAQRLVDEHLAMAREAAALTSYVRIMAGSYLRDAGLPTMAGVVVSGVSGTDKTIDTLPFEP